MCLLVVSGQRRSRLPLVAQTLNQIHTIQRLTQHAAAGHSAGWTDFGRRQRLDTFHRVDVVRAARSPLSVPRETSAASPRVGGRRCRFQMIAGTASLAALTGRNWPISRIISEDAVGEVR